MARARSQASSGGGRLGSELLTQLDRRHLKVLRLPDDWTVVDEITGSRSASQQLIFRLHKSGLLRQIKRGAYAVRPRSRALAVSALELVGAVERDRRHLVTVGQALALEGLSDQSFRAIVVLSPYHQRGWEWQGERVDYVYQPAERIWGGRHLKVASDPTWVARPERAILDSLAHPGWGVSMSQAVEALIKAVDEPRFVDRLAQSAARYGNAAVSRRLGFILSRIAGETTALPFRSLIGTSRAPTLLDPTAPSKRGKTYSEWRVRENVPVELITGGTFA